MRKSEALAYRAKIEHAAEQQTDDDALQSVELFTPWVSLVGRMVETGRRIAYLEKLYRCIQSHIVQPDWTPDVTPALWTEVSVEQWPEWKQPVGASDAYSSGDKVSHNSKHWISDVDNNVWEPGIYGWTDILNAARILKYVQAKGQSKS